MSPQEMDAITALVESDKDRFQKWADRPAKGTGKAWTRKLPDGDFKVKR